LAFIAAVPKSGRRILPAGVAGAPAAHAIQNLPDFTL